MKYIAALIFIFTGVIPCKAIDQVTCNVMLEKTAVRFGETVQYMIVVNYAINTMPPAVTDPLFTNLNILDVDSKVEEAGANHDRYKIMKKIWLLKPAVTGHLVIPSTVITFHDPSSNQLKNEKTRALYIDVETESGTVTGQKPGTATNIPASKSAKGKQTLIIILASAGIVILLFAVLYLLKRRNKKPESDKKTTHVYDKEEL